MEALPQGGGRHHRDGNGGTWAGPCPGWAAGPHQPVLLQDKTLKGTVYRIRGSIPASNYLQLPRTSSQSLGLCGRYLYLLFRPLPRKYFVVHLDVATEVCEDAGWASRGDRVLVGAAGGVKGGDGALRSFGVHVGGCWGCYPVPNGGCRKAGGL